MRHLILLLWLILVGILPVVASTGDLSKQIDKQNPLPTENDALRLAAADILSIPPQDRYFYRYIWIIPSDHQFEDLQCISLALNYISRATVIIQPPPLGQNKLMLVRVELYGYAPKAPDFADLVNVWEEFRFDPRFNLLLTKDTLKFAAGISIPQQKAKSIPKTKKREFKDTQYYKKQGTGEGLGYWDEQTKKYYQNPWIEENYTEEVKRGLFDSGEDVIRVVAPHLDPTLIATLIDGTRSQAPVVNHKYFLFRALSTLQDKGVYKTVFGGLYYQLAGIKRGSKNGTDEDVLLEQLGIGNVDKGITAKKIFDDLRSDQRVAVFRSGITGKPRRVDLLKSLAGRDTQGIVSITHDLKAQSIDVGTHPIMNLLDFKDDAREVIFEKTNGLHGFALFNGQGVLQDVVPPDVAVDNTVPFPNRAELQPAIGCIRCHAKESGWRVLQNDVKTLLKNANIFGDDSDKNKSQQDIVDRLAGLYTGDLENKILPRGRDDYNQNILRASGSWKKSKDQTDIAKLTGDHLGEMYSEYWYQQPNALTILNDLGISVKDPKEAPKILTKLLPPVPLDAGGFIPEDARIVALKVGLGLNRSDYDLVFSFIAYRVKTIRK